MEHLLKFDMCDSSDNRYFLDDVSLGNSVIEKIFQGKFHDPLLSSDSENEHSNVDWSQIRDNYNKKCKNIANYKQSTSFIPGLKPTIKHLKKSALTADQHFRILKILAAEDPHVPGRFIYPKPKREDFKIYEDIKEIYENEQKEYIEWAKTLWKFGNNIRALRPNPVLEQVYDAEYKVFRNTIISLPKIYNLAAQIQLNNSTNEFKFEILHQKDLFKINFSHLPRIQIPELSSRFSIFPNKPYLPEACFKHICQFVLPNQKTKTELPRNHISQMLAYYAVENEVEYILNESSLRCLVELDRPWMIPISVQSVFGSHGVTKNVLVMGEEMVDPRLSSRWRSHSAAKYLLDLLLIKEEKESSAKEDSNEISDTIKITTIKKQSSTRNESDSEESSDEDMNLVIDAEELGGAVEKEDSKKTEENLKTLKNMPFMESNLITCTCKGTPKETPPKRSYKKWRITDGTIKGNIDVIVHTAHKARTKEKEAVLEPILEYQLDVGATDQTLHKLRRLVLSLFLRQNAALVNVRVDAHNGDLVTVNYLDWPEICHKYKCDFVQESANILHTTLSQLKGLLPGEYILEHDLVDRNTAILHVAGGAMGSRCVDLGTDRVINNEKEMVGLQDSPLLSSSLLPLHKCSKILPLAFSPFDRDIARPQKPKPQKVKPSRVAKRKKKNKKPIAAE